MEFNTAMRSLLRRAVIQTAVIWGDTLYNSPVSSLQGKQKVKDAADAPSSPVRTRMLGVTRACRLSPNMICRFPVTKRRG